MLNFRILGLAPIRSSDQQSSQGHNEHPGLRHQNTLVLQRAVQEASLKGTQRVHEHLEKTRKKKELSKESQRERKS